jgi:hypothetical protein
MSRSKKDERREKRWMPEQLLKAVAWENPATARDQAIIAACSAARINSAEGIPDTP